MFDVILFLTLLVCGYVFGRVAEQRHFKSIIEREEQYRDITTFSTRFPPAGGAPVSGELVGGGVVISVDYFKRLVAGLRGIVGGRIAAYESLLERARREAILRMKKDARAKGASQIINVKLETASITKGKKQQVSCVEVFAYGTALIPLARE